jgi:hypothetical protein
MEWPCFSVVATGDGPSRGQVGAPRSARGRTSLTPVRAVAALFTEQQGWVSAPGSPSRILGAGQRGGVRASAQANVVQQANIAGPRMTLFPSRTDWEVARTAAGLASTVSEDMHAGELEVSLLLHGYPELVDDGYRRGDWEANPRPHLLVTGMRGYTDTGVIGSPSLASADKGRAILQSLARSFKDHLVLLS